MIKKKRQNNRIISGYLSAITATAMWSGNFIIARYLNETIPPISLAFLRWSVAIIAFLPFALKPLIAERNILKKHITYLCFTSLLGITTFSPLVYIAAHTTTAINLSLIAPTFPIFIIILSRIFFREIITFNKGIGIMLVAAGVIILITKGSFSKLSNISFAIGDLLILLGAIAFAVYSMLLKRKPEQLNILAFQLSTFIIGLILLSPFFIWEYITVPPVEFDMKLVYSILYLGIFPSLSGFLLWSKAVENLGPSKAGMIYYTLPIFSGILAVSFLKEEIGILHILSVLLIISGILTANYQSKKALP